MDLVNSHLLAAEDQSLLHGRNAFLLLDLALYLGHFVVGLDVEFDFFAREGSHSEGGNSGVSSCVCVVVGVKVGAYLICMVGGYTGWM